MLAQTVHLHVLCILFVGSSGSHPVETDDASPAEDGQ